MSEQFLGEIRAFSFGFAPKGWAVCAGQLLPINQNTALFALLGTTYGGDGRTTFALPDLRGRVGLHTGAAYPQGQSAGSETVTLTSAQIPMHTHAAHGSTSAATQPSPAGNYWAQDSGGNLTFAPTANATMAPGAVGSAGSGQGHPNLQPFLCVNYCIALQGIFPTRS